jgi:hypothetical protein
MAAEGYDGTQNRRMMAKWQNLSSSLTSVANIPNLIWTDIAANMLVGTKSLNDAFPSTNAYEVRMYQRRITYNYLYGIPGLLCWTIWLLWVLMILALLFSSNSHSRISPSAVKSLINRLSVGRALVATEHSESCAADAPTKEWLSKAGLIEIELWGANEANTVAKNRR